MDVTTLIKSAKTLAVGILTMAVLGGCAQLPDVDPANLKKVEWLDGGPRWNDDARAWFHNTSQGTVTIPIPFKWFIALERPSGTGLFSDPEYLGRMGFIRGQHSKYNQTNVAGEPLPVGLARLNGNKKNITRTISSMSYMDDPQTGKLDAIGLTCAACHTGQINYKGAAIGIDGGGANIDLITFNIKLLEAMILTRSSSKRFSRFAEFVLGSKHSDPKAVAGLKANLKSAIRRFEITVLLGTKTKGSVSEGYARIDALSRIGNTVFGQDQLANIGDIGLMRENTAPISAPVSFPFIWDVSWFEWVQYDASIMAVGIRNSGEAMGVSAMVDMVTPSNYWDNTVQVGDIHGMESMLAGLGTSFENTPTPFKMKKFTGLWSPKWPEHILGKIDMDKARAGENLYNEMCAGCHLPPVNPLDDVSIPEKDTFWSTKYWVDEYKPTADIFSDYLKRHGKDGKGAQKVVTNCDKPFKYPWRLLRLPIIPTSVVGTDPAQAKILTSRTVTTPVGMITPNAYTTRSKRNLDENLFALALGDAVQNVNDRWYAEQGLTKKEQDWMNGGRPNCLQATMAYKARPLNGVWATAPFLHNGSVPTLYELLSPVKERRATFYVGNKEYDVKKVGYVADKAKGLFKFDTSKSGNLNIGHEFTGDGSTFGNGVIGRALSHDERMALIEFLKTQ